MSLDLTALLIAPDRELAGEFLASVAQARTFQVTADLKAYPPEQTVEIRMRQLRPDVVLVDLATDLQAACDVIAKVARTDPAVQIVGLHRHNDTQAILRSLRLGAAEFLYSPFDAAVQQEAVKRLCRLRQPEASVPQAAGKIAVFSSAKPGSGATTLALQTAFALQRQIKGRVLLADFDLTGGTVGFSLKLPQAGSILDALAYADQLNTGIWPELISSCAGVDILAAPETPFTAAVDSARLHAVLEHARRSYEYVLIDLPVIFQRTSLMTLSECDSAFLVSTSELPSLHLTRKAVALLDQLGFPRDRYQLVVNRISKQSGLTASDLDKLFNRPIHARFPNDYFSLHRAITLGEPLAPASELGKSIENLAGRMARAAANTN